MCVHVQKNLKMYVNEMDFLKFSTDFPTQGASHPCSIRHCKDTIVAI